MPVRSPLFSPCRARGVLLALSGLGLLWTLGAPASGAGADTLAREASNGIRRARGRMFAGKFQEALDELAKVEKVIAQLKAADPDHRSIKRFERDLQRVRVDVQKRMPASPAQPPTKPGSAAPSGKLPSGVAYRLKRIDQWLKSGNLGRADGLMEEIEKRYGSQIPAGHPEIKAIKARIAALKDKLDAAEKAKADAAKQEAEARAKREATSAPWLAKLNTYVSGYDTVNSRPNPKRLVAAQTGDMAELKRQKALFDEASALFAEYKKAGFPAGKTPELERAEKVLARSLAEFPEAYRKSLAALAAGPQKMLKEAAAALTHDTAWRTDPKKTPNTLSQKRLDAIAKRIAAAAASLPADDPRLAALKTQMAELVRRNAEHHRVRMARTFLIADRFKGKELAAIKAKAAELVRKSFPDAAVLRTTVISKDWHETDVVEYTDTSRTKLRRRITHGLTAQVAAKRGADVFLYAVHVAKNRRADGTWGALYGNLHQSADRMLEKNVHANAP